MKASSEERPPYEVWRGEDVPPPSPVALRAGPVEALVDGVDLRYVRLGETELVRRVYAAVRDPDWRTIPGTVYDREIDARPDGFEVGFRVRHRSADLEFAWRGRVTGEPSGRISAELEGRAERDTTYNRIGFCVLHPVAPFAGQPFSGLTPEGKIEGRLPQLVGPQGFENGVYVPLFPAVSELELRVRDGGRVRFRFEGDLFEGEDQRNWTDASFKTYCTPLGLGFPHHLRVGERIAQRVVIEPEPSRRVAPRTRAAPGSAERVRIDVGEPIGLTLPPLGLARAQDGGLDPESRQTLRALALSHLRVDLRLAHPGWEDALASGLREARDLDAPLELCLHLRAEHVSLVPAIVERLRPAPLARVLVVVAAGATATPEETTPGALVAAVREALAPLRVPVAGGTDMNFCELNRTRPDASRMDAVFYPIVATVHAGDDLSLVETLEAQADTVRTATRLAEGRPVFVSPVTLRPRFNPHARGAEAESAVDELPDSVDVRQRSLLAAAWTVGSVAHLASAGAASITYFETVGWRGVCERPEGSRLPARFPAQPGELFPAFHAFALLRRFRGGALRRTETSDPVAVAGLAVSFADGRERMMLANLGPRRRVIDLIGFGPPTHEQRLNAACAERARHDPNGLPAQPVGVGALEMGPYESLALEARAHG